VRVFAVGPAARNTNQGIIGSNHVRKGMVSPIEDWAGRGGLGSRLLQAHHIAACIFGGDWEDPDLKDSQEIDSYFKQYYGDSMIKVDLGATEKYRYAPGFHTGGTFGVNMFTVEDKLLSFNYASVNKPPAERLAQHENFITNHYLQQFNSEIIEPKNFSHCGEPCSVACKKFNGEFKKDYEPYQALGPLCGIFDQRAAEMINHFTDAMGLDAIQTGGTVAWIMELIRDGLIDPADFGLPPATEMAFHFASTSDTFDVVADSMRNAAYAQKVISMILFEEGGETFRCGIREAARILDERMGLTIPGQRTLDRAVYLAHGKIGGLTPNQYGVPGMVLSPMPMMGKYFVYYGLEFVPPHELGVKNVHRMVAEFFSENTGVCRFHRKWVEGIVDEIIATHYDFTVDYKAHQFALAKAIYDYQGNEASFVDSERAIDMIWKYLEEWNTTGLNNPLLQEWVARFRQDKWSAARSYWEEIRAGIAEAFAAGPDVIPDATPAIKTAQAEVAARNKKTAGD
jgi:glyceraldehyde-3-phosphate dehydrogenase (ferredoxin)